MFDRDGKDGVRSRLRGVILLDALYYTAKRFKPRAMVDLATLTYAVGAALGRLHAGIFCNDEGLAKRLIGAGQATGERLWRLPPEEGLVDVDIDLLWLRARKMNAAEQAFLAALDEAEVKPSEVDIVFSTTVTGLAVPTVEARLAARSLYQLIRLDERSFLAAPGGLRNNRRGGRGWAEGESEHVGGNASRQHRQRERGYCTKHRAKTTRPQ